MVSCQGARGSQNAGDRPTRPAAKTDSRVTNGTLTENDCKPDCADGTDVSEPATVTLSKLKSIGGDELYTQMTITPAPPNVHRLEPITRTLP